MRRVFTSKIKRFTMLLLLCSTVFISFYCEERPEPRNLIRGTVTDSITGAPIDSAQITVGDTLGDTVSPVKIFYSNQQGKYEAYPYTSGVVQVFCRKETYSTKMINLDLTTNRDVYENVDFELVKGT